jgi:hypothetical protein
VVASEAASEAPRLETTVLRIVRDTEQARRIKELYDYKCQICGTRLEGLAGPYAEAAHIKPLGAPHRGPGQARPHTVAVPEPSRTLRPRGHRDRRRPIPSRRGGSAQGSSAASDKRGVSSLPPGALLGQRLAENQGY